MSIAASSGEPSRKHHYIPEFFLKWWTGDDRRLERYTKYNSNHIVAKRCFPSEVGFSIDLYKSPHLDPRIAQLLEHKTFREIDDKAAKVLRKLNSKPIYPLSDDEIFAWCHFVLSTFHRTPEAMSAIKITGGAVMRKTLEDALVTLKGVKGIGKFESIESYADSLDESDIEQSVLSILPGLTMNKNIITFMANLKWIYIDLTDINHNLLISDEPVARTNGLMAVNGHIALPLSPTRLFIAASDVNLLNKFGSTPHNQLVRSMNMWTVSSARHFVAATDRAQDSFIRKHFGIFPKPSISRSLLK